MPKPDEVVLYVATPSDAALLENLMELYLHDLSEVFPIELDAGGRFGYDKLPFYWSEPERRFPFLIRYGTRVVGFVLVTRGSPASDDPDVFDIAEFFVLRRYRRSGVGRRAAFLLWDRLLGQWIVRVSEGNTNALPFWKRAIAEYTNGAATELARPGSPSGWRVFAFASSLTKSGALANDPFGGRHPTSHERMTGRPWDASYHDGPAPWDIGGPQPAIVRLASAGGFTGTVLDAGCGTGENALYIASLGLPVLGFDVAETALTMARQKADDRGIELELAAADAFHLERLGRKFESVLDCGLFHTFDSDERPEYAASLASVTEHDGTLYVLCFSDDGPDTGPHPISQQDLTTAFNRNNGWNVAAIEAERVQTRFHDDGAPAWLATIKRI